ncbi:hypothetical protein [Treponema phagedenis]|uniref:hypothetical protein n=1 Tax=Treponema phagedenis TaxID=162 RepID=UPI002091A7D8|nr:hypothetical protein [Treponema phagedenis]
MIFFTFAKHTFRIIFHLSPRLIKILIDIANTHTLTNEHVENIKSLQKRISFAFNSD